jgi:predicted metal-dependent HD superfamily phosphohydrolase
MQENGQTKLALAERARKYATALLKELDGRFEYHNLSHTRMVARAAEEIALKSGFRGESLENILVAAWFHDTGYSLNIANHEEQSVRIMSEALSKWNISEERIQVIAKIIMATQMPQQPENLMCKILCDADLYHLSEPGFINHSENLRREMNSICNKRLSRSDWWKISMEFIRGHCYFTEYGRKVLGPKKDAIVRKLSHSLITS